MVVLCAGGAAARDGEAEPGHADVRDLEFGAPIQRKAHPGVFAYPRLAGGRGAGSPARITSGAGSHPSRWRCVQHRLGGPGNRAIPAPPKSPERDAPAPPGLQNRCGRMRSAPGCGARTWVWRAAWSLDAATSKTIRLCSTATGILSRSQRSRPRRRGGFAGASFRLLKQTAQNDTICPSCPGHEDPILPFHL